MAVAGMITAFTSMPAAAAERSYVISFRSGLHGSFGAGAESIAVPGVEKIEKTIVSGGNLSSENLYIQVEEGTDLGSLENAVFRTIQAEEGYYLDSASIMTGSGKAEADETYVARYGILSADAGSYSVRYVDENGTDLHEPTMGYADAGANLTFSAENIDGYTADESRKSFTVQNGGVLTFTYSQIKRDPVVNTTTVTEPGRTIVNTQNVTVPGDTITDTDTVTSPGGQNAGGPNAAAAGQDTGTGDKGQTVTAPEVATPEGNVNLSGDQAAENTENSAGQEEAGSGTAEKGETGDSDPASAEAGSQTSAEEVETPAGDVNAAKDSALSVGTIAGIIALIGAAVMAAGIVFSRKKTSHRR